MLLWEKKGKFYFGGILFLSLMHLWYYLQELKAEMELVTLSELKISQRELCWIQQTFMEHWLCDRYWAWGFQNVI